MKRLHLLAGALALCACGGKSQSGLWLTEPDLVTHSSLYFPIDVNDAHGPDPDMALTTCLQCHQDRSTSPPQKITSFATYTCTGCHVEIRPGVFHDDIAALGTLKGHATLTFDPTQVVSFDQSCRSCHPTGWVVSHAAVFPLPHQGAAGAAVAKCKDCHLAPDPTVLASRTSTPPSPPRRAPCAPAATATARSRSK
jgi:predicted CXXCH cytochrome family protein